MYSKSEFGQLHITINCQFSFEVLAYNAKDRYRLSCIDTDRDYVHCCCIQSWNGFS